MKIIRATIILATFTILFLLASSAVVAQERSEDRDNPTPINSKEISDDLDGSEDTFYYVLTVGPGKLTITFEVKANDTNAGAYLDVFDTKSNAILSNVLAQGVDKGSERVVKTINSAKQRNLILRITGIKYGSSGGGGTYKVLFDGAIVIAPPAAPAEKPAVPN